MIQTKNETNLVRSADTEQPHCNSGGGIFMLIQLFTTTFVLGR